MVAERQTVIDGIYRELEDLVNVQLVLQAPVAADLRLLVAVLRILPRQERAHRLVLHIAERASHILSDDLSPRVRGLVERMGDTAADMWNQTSTAWYRRDRYAAGALEERDDDMDSLHAALTAELASGTMRLPVTMDMTLVARYYERFADHAVNIAHRVVYPGRGRSPRLARIGRPVRSSTYPVLPLTWSSVHVSPAGCGLHSGPGIGPTGVAS